MAMVFRTRATEHEVDILHRAALRHKKRDEDACVNSTLLHALTRDWRRMKLELEEHVEVRPPSRKDREWYTE